MSAETTGPVETATTGSAEAAGNSGPAAPAARRLTAGALVAWIVGVLLTLLYAYTVVAAVGNLVMLPRMGAAIGYGITPVGWWWLGFGVALPVIAYALALLFGRRRSAPLRLLVLAVGLCAVAAVQLEIMHLVPQSSFFAS